MNRSGESVKLAMEQFEIQPQNLLVIADDVDLPIGRIRIREKGGFGSHNGLRSIVDHLKMSEFNRLRVGIKPVSLNEESSSFQKSDINLADFVLSPFSNDEEEMVIGSVTRGCCQALYEWMEDGREMGELMNDWNSRDFFEEEEEEI